MHLSRLIADPETGFVQGYSMQRIPEFDGWRAAAVGFVLVAHYFGFPAINLGRLGVELFFVLSGRLMAEILFTRKAEIGSFYIGRLSRVYPALLVFATIAASGEALLFPSDMSWPLYLSAISMTINYTQSLVGHGGIFGHIWSLCVEVHTYIMLGILAIIARRKLVNPMYACLILSGICMIDGLVGHLAGLDYYSNYWRSDVRAASILAGASAYLLIEKTMLQERLPTWLSPALFAFGLILNVDVVPDPVKYTIGSTLLAFALVTLPSSALAVLKLARLPLLSIIGLWSYSIYLWQQPFWRHTEHMWSRALGLSIAISIGYISYRWVEGPSRKFLNKYFGHKPDTIAATGQPLDIRSSR